MDVYTVRRGLPAAVIKNNRTCRLIRTAMNHMLPSTACKLRIPILSNLSRCKRASQAVGLMLVPERFCTSHRELQTSRQSFTKGSSREPQSGFEAQVPSPMQAPHEKSRSSSTKVSQHLLVTVRRNQSCRQRIRPCCNKTCGQPASRWRATA